MGHSPENSPWYNRSDWLGVKHQIIIISWKLVKTDIEAKNSKCEFFNVIIWK